MTKQIFLIAGLMVLVNSCNKTAPELLYECLSQYGEFDPNNEPYRGNSDYEFFYNSEIKVEENEGRVNVDIVEGHNIVFRYQFNKNDNPNIADDEYGEAVYFQIDPEFETFHVSDGEMNNLHTVFGKFCFCVDGGYHKVESGCIHGERVSSKKWKVSFSIKVNSTYEPIIRMVDKDFMHSD